LWYGLWTVQTVLISLAWQRRSYAIYGCSCYGWLLCRGVYANVVDAPQMWRSSSNTTSFVRKSVFCIQCVKLNTYVHVYVIGGMCHLCDDVSGLIAQKLNLNQHSSLRTAHVCVRIIVHDCRTQQSTEHLQPDGDFWRFFACCRALFSAAARSTFQSCILNLH